MLHSGVCMVRQYCEFSGITRGQNNAGLLRRAAERQHASARPMRTARRASSTSKVAALRGDWRARQPQSQACGDGCGRRAIDAPGRRYGQPGYRVARNGTRQGGALRPALWNVHAPQRVSASDIRHSAEYDHAVSSRTNLPIGVPKDGPRAVHVPGEASQSNRFSRLPEPPCGTVSRAPLHGASACWFPLTLLRATSAYEAAIREELLTPLRLSAVDELRWYFEMKVSGTRASAPTS